jgi:hypothetical protein
MTVGAAHFAFSPFARFASSARPFANIRGDANNAAARVVVSTTTRIRRAHETVVSAQAKNRTRTCARSSISLRTMTAEPLTFRVAPIRRVLSAV